MSCGPVSDLVDASQVRTVHLIVVMLYDDPNVMTTPFSLQGLPGWDPNARWALSQVGVSLPSTAARAYFGLELGGTSVATSLMFSPYGINERGLWLPAPAEWDGRGQITTPAKWEFGGTGLQDIQWTHDGSPFVNLTFTGLRGGVAAVKRDPLAPVAVKS